MTADLPVPVFYAIAAFAELLALGLLFRRHPSPYLLAWVVGQLFVLISASCQYVELMARSFKPASFVSSVTVLGHSLFYLIGIQLFARKPFPKWPYALAAVAVMIYAFWDGFLMDDHGLSRVTILPVVVGVYWMLSRLFFLEARCHPYIGLKLAAWSFLAHGTISLLYPLSFYVPAIQQYGYLAAGALSLLEAFAFLLIPTEQAECELTCLKHSLELQVERRTSQILKQERMAAIGQVAAGVAHEIKNKLNVINASAYYLVHRLPSDPDMEKASSYIQASVKESGRILTDLLQIGRPTSPQLEPLEVSRLIAPVASLVVPKSIQTEMDIEPDLPLVLADRQQLEQVLLNLCLNAVEAMPTGGTLTVRATRRESHVEITLADTGAGLPADIADHLFEPFRTTKEKGTGLGLAISRSLIEQQRGSLSLESAPGGGTTARIVLLVA